MKMYKGQKGTVVIFGGFWRDGSSNSSTKWLDADPNDSFNSNISARNICKHLKRVS